MLLIMEPINILLRVVIFSLAGTEGYAIVTKVLISIIFYPWGALWFLQACIVAVVLIVPYVLKEKEERLIVPSLALYSVMLLCNRYYFLIADTKLGNIATSANDSLSSMRNGLTVGLPFILAGILIAKHWNTLQHFLKLIRTITFLSFITLLIEAVLTNSCEGLDDRGMFISFIIFIPALFATMATVPINLKIDTTLLRNLSTSLFLLHSPIISLITIIQLLLFNSSDGGVKKALVEITTIIAVIILIYSNKKSKVFNYLT